LAKALENRGDKNRLASHWLTTCTEFTAKAAHGASKRRCAPANNSWHPGNSTKACINENELNWKTG